MADVAAGPAVHRDPEAAKTKALANLRQATWEATQFLDRGEVETFVYDVLDEVERRPAVTGSLVEGRPRRRHSEVDGVLRLPSPPILVPCKRCGRIACGCTQGPSRV